VQRIGSRELLFEMEYDSDHLTPRQIDAIVLSMGLAFPVTVCLDDGGDE
jgi:hypothetical protein